MILYRQYKIIELISYEKRWFSLCEIAESVNCSVKTIQRDLQQIDNFLPENWKIDFSKKKNVRLVKPLTASIESIQAIYFRHTLLFQTLEQLLNENFTTLKELSARLYIHPAKLRSIIVEIIKYLQKYNLELTQKPLRIIGNETNIMVMYYELYLKAYSDKDWPFESSKKEIFTFFLKRAEKILNIKFYKESLKKMSFFIYIFFKRRSNGYQISVNAKIIKDICQLSVYKEFKKMTRNVLYLYNLYLQPKDIVILLLAIHHAEYFHPNKKVIVQKYLSSILKPNHFIFDCMKQIINFLEQQFSISLFSDEEFIFSLLSIFKVDIFKLKLFSTKKYETYNTKYVKNKHIQTFNIINYIIKKHIQSNNLSSDITDNDIAILTMHIEAILMKTKRKKKKIILFLNDGEAWERYIKEFLIFYYNKDIDFLTVPHYKISEDILIKENVSCVITNVPLSYKCSPVILISRIPTLRDLEEISKFI